MKTTTLLFLLALAGCASSQYTTTPAYDARFGQAVLQAKQLMILNPTPAPVDVQGIDGRSAHEAIGRYQDSFKTPPPVVNVINIGGATGSSGR